MIRAWMYATVAGVTYGVGECLVVLIAGKVDLRRPQTVLDLALMRRAAMPWLLVNASKRWQKRSLWCMRLLASFTIGKSTGCDPSRRQTLSAQVHELDKQARSHDVLE
jgi:hypothetical protein